MSRIRRLAGSVIASGEYESPTSESTPLIKWCKWRVYADGWCEQIGVVKETNEVFLKIPYASETSWSLVLTMNYHEPTVATGYGFSHYPKTYKSFTAHVANDDVGDGYLDMHANGYISPESLAAIKAGKTWDPSTETWS